MLKYLAKQDAKRKAEEAARAKKAAADAEKAAAARGDASKSGASSSVAQSQAGGGATRASKYNFNGRTLSHINFECNPKKKGAASDAPSGDNSSAASDIKTYTTRGMNVAPLGGSVDKSEGAGERNRPRIERLAQRTLKQTGAVAGDDDMTDVAMRVRKNIEMNTGYKAKWRAAAKMSLLYMSSHYAVHYSKGAPGLCVSLPETQGANTQTACRSADPKKALGRNLTQEEEKSRKAAQMGERKTKAMSTMQHNKAERTRGDMTPTRKQNDAEREEQRAEARASSIEKDGPGREVTNKRLTPRSSPRGTPRATNKVDPTDQNIAKV